MFPHTTVILAMTLDGKIADYQKNKARFGSDNDKNHLEHQISLVDGVLFGAETLRAYETSLPITNPTLINERLSQNQSPQPVHIVCSASGNLNPQWRFFRQPIPRWLLTTEKGKQKWECFESQAFERVLILDQEDNLSNWRQIFQQLFNLKLQRLAILGGGQLIATLLEADLIDEWQITLCPVILGGETAPTPVEGKGFLAKHRKQLELISVKTVTQEVFLHYRQIKNHPPSTLCQK